MKVWVVNFCLQNFNFVCKNFFIARPSANKVLWFSQIETKSFKKCATYSKNRGRKHIDILLINCFLLLFQHLSSIYTFHSRIRFAKIFKHFFSIIKQLHPLIRIYEKKEKQKTRKFVEQFFSIWHKKKLFWKAERERKIILIIINQLKRFPTERRKL